jgi:hypothetical protein
VTQFGRRFGLAFAVLALPACSPPSSKLQRLEISIAATDEAVRNCVFDTLQVPLQNSGNCLAAARLLAHSELYEVCGEKTDFHCRRLKQQSSEAHGWYWRAVAQSLLAYGRPQEFQSSERYAGRDAIQFLDVPLLEQAFSNCLKEEAAERASKVGLNIDGRQPMLLLATSIPDLLVPGQKCVREDYARPWSAAPS